MAHLHCQELEELLRHAPLVDAFLPPENDFQLFPQAGVGYLGHLRDDKVGESGGEEGFFFNYLL